MKDFRGLKVWNDAHAMALVVYRATQKFPQAEVYGLTSQLRRSVSSIPANLAEGCGCDSDREFARFVQIAFRSASETEYHLILARDLGYLSQDDYRSFNANIVEIKQMLSSLIRKLKADSGHITDG